MRMTIRNCSLPVFIAKIIGDHGNQCNFLLSSTIITPIFIYYKISKTNFEEKGAHPDSPQINRYTKSLITSTLNPRMLFNRINKELRSKIITCRLLALNSPEHFVSNNFLLRQGRGKDSFLLISHYPFLWVEFSSTRNIKYLNINTNKSNDLFILLSCPSDLHLVCFLHN